MEEDVKAVQEVAKTVGEAIRGGRELAKFLSKYIDRPLKQAMGIVEDKLKYMRWVRALRLIDQANKILKNRGLEHPTRPVPLSIIVPLMQGGSIEENDDLQDRWATLLVNAADADSGVEMRRAFLSILEDLTSLDVLVLEKIYSVQPKQILQPIFTKYLPDRIVLEPPREARDDPRPSPDVEIAISNLARLGLVSGAMTWDGRYGFEQIHQTLLGREFVRACSCPQSK